MANYPDPGTRPYDYFHKVMGGRWKAFLVRGCFHDGSIRFNEMRRILSISEKILAQNLRELERDGIIYRIVYPEVPLRVEYRLTSAGEKLRPIYDLIYLWSLEQLMEKEEAIAPLTFRFHDDVCTNAYK